MYESNNYMQKGELQLIFGRSCVLSLFCVCVCTQMSSSPNKPDTYSMAYYSRRHTQKCVCLRVCVCCRVMGKGRGSLFNGRDRGPWRLSSPQLEALEERLGAVLLIQVGLIMPVHPLPPSLPPLQKIWEETGDKGDKEEEEKEGVVCVCAYNLWPSLQLSMSSGDLRDFPSVLLVLLSRSGTELLRCSTFTPQPSFVEAALGLINTKTICQTLSTGSGNVPQSSDVPPRPPHLLNQWTVAMARDSNVHIKGEWKPESLQKAAEQVCFLFLNSLVCIFLDFA